MYFVYKFAYYVFLFLHVLGECSLHLQLLGRRAVYMSPLPRTPHPTWQSSETKSAPVSPGVVGDRGWVSLPSLIPST